MASLSEVRQGLVDTIKAYVAQDEFFAYAKLLDNPQFPCVIAEPADADFEGAMVMGMDVWYFHLYIMCARGDTETSQTELDEFITGSGPNSVRRAIYLTPSLGLDESTDAQVQGMFGYGGKLESVGLALSGAALRVKVITDGRA